MKNWHIKGKLTPAGIVAIYAFVGGLWIVASDKLLSLVFRDPAISQMTHLQTIKGWMYVLVTALMLQQLIWRYSEALLLVQKQLKQNQDRLKAIIETNTDGIVVLDRDGHITLANAAAEKYLGVSRQNLIEDRQPQYPICEVYLPFMQVMQTGKPVFDLEHSIIQSDGNQVILSINAAPLQDSNGNCEGVVASITDITRHKQVEIFSRERDVAAARSQAKSEFLAHMSHELRTPLNSILGFSGMLQRELYGPLNAKQKEYVTAIKSSGDHLLELINDILDLSKVEAGREELSFSQVVVADLCKYCLKIVQERAYDKGLQLISVIDSEAVVCVADERRLKQMLLNLLSNAIKFTEVGEVCLMVEKQANQLTFTVSDTGIGISNNDLELVFQPFRQIDNLFNRQIKGTGLGLALTRNLARLHGGDVTVESVLGEGSKFKISLPDVPVGYVMPIEENLPKNVAPAENYPRSGRILIVDGDPANVMLLRDYLQVSGYRVKHLWDASNFLQEVQDFTPDLILMEVRLPLAVNGLDLLAQLRRDQIWHDLPVVMVTAMAMAGDRERCLDAGASDYLSKPVQLDRLESLILQYLPASSVSCDG